MAQYNYYQGIAANSANMKPEELYQSALTAVAGGNKTDAAVYYDLYTKALKGTTQEVEKLIVNGQDASKAFRDLAKEMSVKPSTSTTILEDLKAEADESAKLKNELDLLIKKREQAQSAFNNYLPKYERQKAYENRADFSSSLGNFKKRFEKRSDSMKLVNHFKEEKK